MNIKIAHFADVHVGHKHSDWIDEALAAGVATAKEAGCDVAVFAGDFFDSSIHVHHPAVGKSMARVRDLADHMPVIFLQGTYSHDRPGSLDIFKTLGGKFPVFVADKVGQVLLTSSRNWQVLTEASELIVGEALALFSCLPSQNPAELRAQDAEARMADYVLETCRSWAPLNQQARSIGVPTIMISHGTVNGCVTESKRAMVSQDHEFGTGALFAAEASAVMLGHIHKHQSWEQDGRVIAYAGSITTLVYGVDDPTGFLIWSVRAEGAISTFRPLPARRLIDLDYDGKPDMADIAARLESMSGAYVRLRYQIDEEHRASVDNEGLRQMLEAAGAVEIQIEPRINPVVRSRAEGIADRQSDADKITMWAELNDVPAGPLVARLAMLNAGTQPGARA